MKKLISVLMLTLALGAFAFSQAGTGGGGGRGQGRGGGGAAYGRAGMQYAALNHADVQAALKISDDQKTKLEAAVKARADAFQAAQGDRAAATKAGEDFVAAVGGILTSDQKTQLLGILALLAKGQALENPDVQAALGLGDDEKGKIKTLVEEANKANAELRQKVQDGSMDQQAANEARAKNTQTLNDSLLGAITPDHKSSFDKLVAGANFTPDPNIRNYFGGGMRRPAGGGGGGGGR